MQDKQITQLPGSLITDTSYNNQPEGTHRYALNALPETTSGDQGFVSNEPGNTQCINLNGYSVIGSIPLTNNETILFVTNGTNSRILLQQDCNVEIVVDAECLNFSDLYPITGTAKIRKGCNRVIYFRDSFNSDRSIDLDEILNNPTNNRYYNGSWKCELFKLAPDFDFPCMDYIRTNNSGGSLKLGTYQFGISLGDEDLNFTNVLTVTQPIPIISGTLNSDNTHVEGGDPTQEIPTTKSIDFIINNLDTDYQYIKIYAIESIGGIVTAYEADTLAINNTSLNYTYRGVDYNSAVVVELSKINVPTPVYDKSKTMEQHDNRLLRANLQERTINNSVFQRAANLIKTRYVTLPKKYNSNEGPFSGDFYVDNRSYMRDEVYALAISAVYTDGTESPKYHIPARLLDTSSTGTTLPLNSDPSGQNGDKQHNRKDPITGWDSTEYTVVDYTTYPQITAGVQDWNVLIDSGGGFHTLTGTQIGIEDVQPLNKNAGDTVKRWEVYNTAYIDEKNTIYGGYYTKGQTSYWESVYYYPNTEDCSGNRIYPTGKIRHHKMPDTTLEPHFINDGSNDYILSLGLEFDLQAFMSFLQSNLGSEFDEIQGFKIARCKRDKGNKSVLDKGLSYRTMEMLYRQTSSSAQDSYLLQTSMFNKHGELLRDSGWAASRVRLRSFGVSFDNTTVLPDENTFITDRSVTNGDLRYSYQYLDIHNPQSKFNKDSTFQFIKMEKELFGKYEFWGNQNSWLPNENSRASFRCVYNNYSTNTAYKGTPNPYFTNRTKFDAAIIPVNENITFDSKRVIGKTKQESLISKLGNYPDISNDSASYGGSPSDTFGSFDNYLTNYIDPTTYDQYYSKAYYIALKNYNPSQYGQLHGLTYYDINTCLISKTATVEVLFGGDTFISQLSFRKTYTDDDFDDDSYGDERTWWAAVSTYFVESEINTKLRHEGYDGSPAQWYYPYHGTTISDIEDVIFGNDETLIEDNNISTIIDNYITGNYCFNNYNYNQDYSREQELQPKFPLALGFDYCSRCINEYPNRIAFSEKSYQEEIFDNYRKFLANNYRDLQANTGEIQNIFKESDNLYIRTLHSLWFVPSKYQNLETTGGTINIGTGELFSIPPKEISSTRYGYNGGQTTLDLVVNQYGAFYADTSSGIVFQVGGEQQQVEISKTGGNRIWFENNLPFFLLKHTSTFNLVDSPTSKMGIGLLGYYDPTFRRYILTKKDYYPVYPDVTTYNEIDKVWYVGLNGTIIEVTDPYNSPDYFENKSWTISYYLESKKWVSWHSYLPNYAWGNLDTFYSYSKNDNYIWEHNFGDFHTFYGVKYPHIIEYVVTKEPTATKISDALNYISDVSKYNDIYQYWSNVKNITFTQAIFYNSTQSTGLLDILIKNTNDPFASVLGTFDPSNIYAEMTESNWNINNIRDMVDQTNPEQPIFTSNWAQLQTQYPIDKVPNMNIINYLTKSQFDMEPLRDNFMACRLYFKPTENYRITTKYLTNKQSFSPR